MADYSPQITACRLYKKTSSKGTEYFVGRWGMMKIALLKSREVADDGAEIWNMILSEAPQKPREQAPRADYAKPAGDEPPPLKDEMPF
ncbi:MAG: hypothetical protein AB1781_11125 [Pseudomonadota bacterium]